MDNTLAVGIFGLCHLHPRSYMPHLQAIEDYRVVAVAEANEGVRAGFIADFPMRGYADWREMLEQERLDVALLFLPHVDCPDAAVACAERGIHLIVEKPMAASAAGLQRMVIAAEASRVLLTTPYLWRYHPVARAMKGFIADGVLGCIVGCEGRCAAGRLDRYIQGHSAWMLNKAQSGGGPMYNLGVHWIDLYRWLLDDEVVEVIGKNVQVNAQYDIEDNSFALLTFSRGSVVALDISYTVPDAYPYGRDLALSLRGTSGVLAWNPSFEGVREKLFVCSDTGDFAGSPRRSIDFELEALPGYCGTLGRAFLHDVAQRIRHTDAPAITGYDGLRALEIVEAIYQSATSGKAVQLATPANT
jgi:predicted dehydrogenase